MVAVGILHMWRALNYDVVAKSRAREFFSSKNHDLSRPRLMSFACAGITTNV